MRAKGFKLNLNSILNYDGLLQNSRVAKEQARASLSRRSSFSIWKVSSANVFAPRWPFQRADLLILLLICKLEQYLLCIERSYLDILTHRHNSMLLRYKFHRRKLKWRNWNVIETISHRDRIGPPSLHLSQRHRVSLARIPRVAQRNACTRY